MQVKCCGTCVQVCYNIEDRFYCALSKEDVDIFKIINCENYIEEIDAHKELENIMK
ncbi:MAG: hypothetical protein ACRC18_06710 [Cetobacterium sp.]